MLGAIAGDIIGSVYEARPIKTKAFEFFHPAGFTDDTVCTSRRGRGADGGRGLSPVGWLAEDARQVLQLAADTARISHDHPHAVAATQALRSRSSWLARA